MIDPEEQRQQDESSRRLREELKGFLDPNRFEEAEKAKLARRRKP